jgi:predicted nucleotide-binding protein
VDNPTIIHEMKRYESTLAQILSRFKRTRDGIYIGNDDDPLFRQIFRELVDFFNDVFGSNSYSYQIEYEFQQGVSNYLRSPSYKSVENILSIVRAALTRIERSPDLLDRKRAQESTQQRENVFIIHGRDEAKWRELKDIVRSEFRLNPIVLAEQPNAGSETVIEKFERYGQQCAYAIAVFTPDDEVLSGNERYLQSRPNVIYELGWFCGRLGRGGVMLLLKEGTSLFSDFGGIIQIRFSQNISERLVEMRRDLIDAGIIDVT